MTLKKENLEHHLISINIFAVVVVVVVVVA